MSSEGVFVGETEKKMELETLDLKWLPFESRLERSFAEANNLWFKFRFPIKGPFPAAQNNTEKAPPLPGLGTPQADAAQRSLGRKLTWFSLFK